MASNCIFSAYVIASEAITSTVAPDRIAYCTPRPAWVYNCFDDSSTSRAAIAPASILLAFCGRGNRLIPIHLRDLKHANLEIRLIHDPTTESIVSSSTLNLPRLDILINIDGEYIS